jgi:hypothetical protein
MWGYWQLSLRLLMFGFLVPMSIGITLLLAGYFLTRNSSDLEEHGDVVRARVRQQDAHKDGLWVQFEYLDEQGKLQKGTAILRGSTASAVQTSGYIEIRYDRRRPEIYDIATNGSQSFDRSVRIGVLVAGILFVTLALVLVAFRAVRIFRIYRLLKNGFVVNCGVRVHVREDKTKPATQFTYAYQGPNGRWYEGISPVLPPNYLDRFPVGQPIRVVFDRDTPRRSEVDVFGIRLR